MTTMRRALGVVILVLLACGPGEDTPTSGPAGPAEQASAAGPAEQEATTAGPESKTLEDLFVWGDASQPAHDWDVDVAECRKRANEDAELDEEGLAVVKAKVFMQCIKDMGWVAKGKSR